MSEIRTLDDFKKNLQLIESRLNSNDLCDPTEDLVKMKTWIDHVQLPETEQQHRQHLIREGLPKVVKAVLKRRYANNDTHIMVAASFLQDAATFAARVLNETPDVVDGQFSLLTELFDPKQPFYQKYGHAKAAVLGGTNVVDLTGAADAPHVEGISRELDAAHATFLNELEEGSCFDYLYAPGKWELAIIESVSTTRERFNISFPEKGKTEWLTISEHKDKMAPYMTKVKTMGEDPTVMTDDTTNPMISHGEVAGGGGSNMDGEDDMWRFDVAPGMLIDAKDLQNNWFQVILTHHRRHHYHHRLHHHPHHHHHHHHHLLPTSAPAIPRISSSILSYS